MAYIQRSVHMGYVPKVKLWKDNRDVIKVGEVYIATTTLVTFKKCKYPLD